MSEYIVQHDTMVGIADAIRTMTGTADKLSPNQIATSVTAGNAEVDTQSDLIAQISAALDGKAAGGSEELVLQNKTVIPSASMQIIEPDSGYTGLSYVTVEGDNNLVAKNIKSGVSIFGVTGMLEGDEPVSIDSFTIDVSNGGLITATAVLSNSSNPSTIVKQLDTQAAQTITPSTVDQTIASGQFLTGTQTVKGDANLTSDNIKSGINIFGIVGNYTGNAGLPDDGEVETCILTCMLDGPSPEMPTIYSVDGSGSYQTNSFADGKSIVVQKNTIVVAVNWSSMSSASGNIQYVHYNTLCGAFFITGDATLIYAG